MMKEPNAQRSLDALKKQLEEGVTQRQRKQEQRADLSPARSAFREAACVLTSFDPATLRPFRGTAEPGAALKELREDAVLVENDEGHSRWALLASIRRQALKALGTRRRMLEALAANPDRPGTIAQRIFESYIRGDAPRPEEQDLPTLEGSLQAVRWLGRTVPDLPDQGELLHCLEERRLYAPFEQLAGKHFRGRTEELRTLRDYVGLFPPEHRAVWELRPRTRLKKRAPLVIYGPGGVGKSTLIGKLILDHGRLDDTLRIPFAYLDFDNPALIIDEPTTLLIEALLQLSIQYAKHYRACLDLARDMQEELLDRETSATFMPLDPIGEIPLYDQFTELRASQQSWDRDSISRFASIVRSLPAPMPGSEDGGLPLLLVLDTFEEVQYRSQAQVGKLWEWLADLQDQLPVLRTVVSGRAPVEDLRVNGRQAEKLPLGDLDAEAAVGYLQAKGLTDEQLAAVVARQVGGNPLSLALAAEVLRREGQHAVDQDGIKDIRRPVRRLRLRGPGSGISEGLIQGVLYQRILDHIKDPDVRKLAHPGLVLRRVTPELIMQVLAVPCGIAVQTSDRASELFEALRKEITLVSPAADGSLRHRQDVRRLMLGLLQRDRPKQVREIHEAAAAYYASQRGDIARAEEIYHRLWLGEDKKQLDRLWTPGVGEYLRGTEEELPAPGQVFLARHMDLVIPRDLRRRAELQDWEQLAAQRCRELLRSGDIQTVGRVLLERRDRSLNSPLNLIDVVRLVSLGEWEDSFPAAQHALDEAEQASDRVGIMRSCVAIANLDHRSEAWYEADEMLERAGAVARRLDDPVMRLGALLQRLILRHGPQAEELATTGAATVADLREQAVSVFAELPDQVLTDEPELTRTAMAELGRRSAAVLQRGLRLVGLGSMAPGDLDEVARAIDSASSGSVDQLGDSVARTLGLEASTGSRWWTILPNAPSATRLDEIIDRVLEATPGQWEILAAVADAVAKRNSWSLYVSVYSAIVGGSRAELN
jgi:hypothetical protein